MSSIQNTFAQTKKSLTKIFTVSIPSYEDSTIDGDQLPIPFYVTNQGVLEIRIQDGVQTDLLTIGTFTSLGNDPIFQAKVMGGARLVTSLGQTVKDFLIAWINESEGDSPSGEFELIVSPVMTKLQFSTNPGQFNELQVASLSFYVPSGTEYVTGEESNVYRTVWTFQSPMTVKYYSVADGVYKYASLLAAFDAD